MTEHYAHVTEANAAAVAAAAYNKPTKKVFEFTMASNLCMPGPEFMKLLRERIPELDIPASARSITITAAVDGVVEVEYIPMRVDQESSFVGVSE